MDYFNMDERHRQHLGNDLPASKYQNWFSAVVNDDIEYVSEILSQASIEEKHTLLTLPFNYHEKDKTNMYHLATVTISYPFHLAVALSCRKVAKLFLFKYKVDVAKTDVSSSNVLHCCVLAAFMFPKLEESICKSVVWLLEQVDFETLSLLMKQENNDGLRPLEYSAQQGCLKLMKTFMESQFYVLQEQAIGFDFHRVHDVTEYELGVRHAKSPLSMLVTLDKEKLSDPATCEVIMSPLISGWISAKIRSNVVIILVWLLLRVFVLGAYFVIDADVSFVEQVHGNNSAAAICPQLASIRLTLFQSDSLTYFILAFCAAAVLFDIIELIKAVVLKLHLRYTNVSGMKKSVSNTVFFAVANTLLILVMGFCSIQNVFGANSGKISLDMVFIIEIFRGFVPVLAVWSVGYFLQLIPVIGSGIISVQGMMIDMAKFMILFLLMILPFVHVFQSFVLVHSDVCITEFSSFFNTLYTLFKLMLNSYDVTTLKVTQISVVYIFHVFYVFMVAVLLLNFLIAIMSSSAAQIRHNERVLIKLNQLAVVIRLEDRVFWVLKPLFFMFRRIGFSCSNSRTFILSSVCNFEDIVNERAKSMVQ